MKFAHPVPPWLLAILAVAAVALAAAAYMGARRVLRGYQFVSLVALRALTLAALLVFLLRPVVPAERQHPEGTVAIVIDRSASMGLADDGRTSRLKQAVSLVRDRLMPGLARGFHVEVFGGGDTLEPVSLDRVQPSGAETDLEGTIRSVEDRYANGGLTGIVLLSDGAETHRPDQPLAQPNERSPVMTVGVGRPVAFDREVRSLTVSPSILDGSLVDVAVTTSVRGAGARGRVRVLQNGRVVHLREIPEASGAPLQHVFTVAPDRGSPTLVRVELDGDERELTLVNNRMDVLIPPPGRRRRVLMLEGAPGFEHTFLKRAWQQDTSLEIDSVVRKGHDERGADTFYVQAAGTRTAALSKGFPDTREALYAYDMVVLANCDVESFSREHLGWLADFVGERGGGLLMFGSRTLSGQGVDGSPLERVVPLDLNGRRDEVTRVAAATDAGRFKVMPTPDGLRHPLMRLSPADGDRLNRWTSLPPLAGTAVVGGPRAGASVLAVTASATGGTVPLVAVQRFGRGRVLLFGGEASWRWKMLMPAADRTFETFWRQTARWLAIQSPEPVTVAGPVTVPVGAAVRLDATIRDRAFQPVEAPDVEYAVRRPDGTTVPIPAAPVGGSRGGFTTALVPSQPGVYRISVQARKGTEDLGTAEHLVLAGGIEPEFVDPGLNEPVLRRVATESGGRFVAASDVDRIPAWLRDTLPPPQRDMRDLWHNAWSFLAVIALLSVEWTLRRRWGLR